MRVVLIDGTIKYRLPFGRIRIALPFADVHFQHTCRAFVIIQIRRLGNVSARRRVAGR